jgi:hypothetical protein
MNLSFVVIWKLFPIVFLSLMYSLENVKQNTYSWPQHLKPWKNCMHYISKAANIDWSHFDLWLSLCFIENWTITVRHFYCYCMYLMYIDFDRHDIIEFSYSSFILEIDSLFSFFIDSATWEWAVFLYIFKMNCIKYLFGGTFSIQRCSNFWYFQQLILCYVI